MSNSQKKILAMILHAKMFQLFLGNPTSAHETNPNWFQSCMKDQYCQNQMIISDYFYELLMTFKMCMACYPVLLLRKAIT